MNARAQAVNLRSSEEARLLLGSHRAGGSALRQHRAQRLLRSLKYVRFVNVLVYLSFPLLEQPSWCYAQRHCGSAADEHVMASTLPTLSTGASQVITR